MTNLIGREDDDTLSRRESGDDFSLAGTDVPNPDEALLHTGARRRERWVPTALHCLA